MQINATNPQTPVPMGPCSVLLPQAVTPNAPLAYIFVFDAEQAQAVQAPLDGHCTPVFVWGAQWNRDYSPWPAPAIADDQEAFAGGAPTFLEQLCAQVLPQTETALHLAAPRRILAGYSLAGLFSLWAALTDHRFAAAACVSGSVWYDGFLPWALAHAPAQEQTLYFSVGRREAATKNARMACVQSNMEQLCAAWNTRCRVLWELNNGGHFTEPDERLARGINALCAP